LRLYGWKNTLAEALLLEALFNQNKI